MFKNLKKFLVLIPCMVVAFLLFTNSKALAGDAVLLRADSVIVGSRSKENTYYFPDSNSSTWEFQTSFKAIKDWDTFLKWRVVRPDGMATKWSEKDYYVDNDGKFIIGDYSSLSYYIYVGLDGRTSVAPLSTYYVDIEYYGELIVSWHQEEKDETIKVVVAENSSDATPVVDLSFNSSTNKYSVNASFKKDGYGIITSIEYFFATDDMLVNKYTEFTTAMNQSSKKGNLSVTPSNKVSGVINGDSTAKELYVAVKTGNGYVSIVSYEVGSTGNNGGNQTQTGGQTDTTPQENPGDESTGLFDYDIGELILIVLVIVLIVSCALIITQKIVDYKKRLY